MAIWEPDPEVDPVYGAVGGEVWARAQGSPTLSCVPRPANRYQRRQFRSWVSYAGWSDKFQGLTAAQKAAWAAFAAEHYFYGFTGRPAFISARDYFVRYWAQVAFITEAEPLDYENPPSPPEWSDNTQPFEEFTEEAAGMAFVCREARDEALDFLVVAQIPLPGRGKLIRSRTVSLGKLTLEAGEAGQLWNDPADEAVLRVGADIMEGASQQWFLAWEISHGFPRPVLDPCNTPSQQAAGYPLYVRMVFAKTGFTTFDAVLELVTGEATNFQYAGGNATGSAVINGNSTDPLFIMAGQIDGIGFFGVADRFVPDQPFPSPLGVYDTGDPDASCEVLPV